MSPRVFALLALALLAAPINAVTAQQPVATTTSSTNAVAPAGPLVSVPLQRVEPTLSRSRSGSSSYRYKSQHTVVISTLVLVLAVVIIVLLIAK